jgi:hypothetical protein
LLPTDRRVIERDPDRDGAPKLQERPTLASAPVADGPLEARFAEERDDRGAQNPSNHI